MRVTVTSFSLSLESPVEMGGVTPRYLSKTGGRGLLGLVSHSNLLLTVIHCAVVYEEDEYGVEEMPC